MAERDAELIKISDQDREYAYDLLTDLVAVGVTYKPHSPAKQIIEQWLCKHRYESVMADRKSR